MKLVACCNVGLLWEGVSDGRMISFVSFYGGETVIGGGGAGKVVF